MTKVDPRLAERRRDVARSAGRRRLRILLVLAGVAAAVLSVAAVLLSPLLDVDRVEVRGAKRTSVAAVLHTTGLSNRGHAMITVDRFALARSVERLPWVATATVTRLWPNAVRVAITERSALGVIAVPGGVALLDKSGRVLATASSPPPNTFAVVIAPGDTVPGPGQSAAAPIRAALRILAALSLDMATKVEAVHRLPGAPATYDLAVRGGVTIRIGEAEQVAAKLASAEAVLAAKHTVGTLIDVRVARSPAVTRAVFPTTTTAPPTSKPQR